MYGYLVALLIGCTPQPATISLSDDPIAVVYSLDSLPLPEASVFDAQGKAMSPAPTVTWTIDDPKVASIDLAAGTVVPAGEGTAVFTATAGKASAEWHVRVVIPDALEITGATERQAVPVGDTLRLTAALTDAGGPIPSQPTTWSTSDPAVATVTNGDVTVLAPGSVKITAACGDLTDEIQLEVVNNAATTDTLPPEETADL